MTIRTVLRMGEPLLLQQAQAVTEFDTPTLHALIQDLEDTMQAMNGAGIAAPQIGESVQVVIFGQKTSDGAANPRYPDADQVPYTVLINPVLTPVGTDMEDGWEGCLSVPGLRGEVPRYTRLHYTGFDQYGKPIDRLVSGFHARVVQHECDHLNGILYPMRIKDMKKFGFTDIIFAGRDIQDD
jgi:peptide deformylase